MRLVYVVALLGACTPAPRTGDHVDAPPSHQIDSAPMVCYEPAVTGMVMAGAAHIDSCAIWNSLAQMTGDVTVTRAATTMSMAFASGVTFAGTVIDRNVMLTYTHLHDFSDGCKWRATETLNGDLDPASCLMMLSYTYVESVEISNGACATPCAANGSFSLQITPVLQ
jgi:hypothetical protein